MVLHIPHSSREIPENLRDQIVLSDNDLSIELIQMTDEFTDGLFDLPGASKVIFPISRLLVDVERFLDNAKEPMSKVGMGAIYTLTASGKTLRRTLQPYETDNLITQYYEIHHQALLSEVKDELTKYGNALIVDCHSFPSQPLPCDTDQATPRPEFCIGTDSFHTPTAMTQMAVRWLEKEGFSVGINQPYAGSLVPMALYMKDRRVASVMVEVNRSLYMDELTGMKTPRFESTKEHIGTLLGLIWEFQQ